MRGGRRWKRGGSPSLLFRPQRGRLKDGINDEEETRSEMEAVFYLSGCWMMVVTVLGYELIRSGDRGLHWDWDPVGPAGPNANLAGADGPKINCGSRDLANANQKDGVNK
ncbi:hypothetical protein PAMP_001164 [Pampus punctatissimus]